MVGLDATGAARLADDLQRDGETLQSVWRYAIVQLLDDYSHELARAGAVLASRRFSQEPPATRSAEVDAALAAVPHEGRVHHRRRAEPGMAQGPLSADEVRRLFRELAAELDAVTGFLPAPDPRETRLWQASSTARRS